MVDADALKADIDRIERADAMSTEVRAVRPPEQAIENRDSASQNADLEKRAFNTYVRQGISAVKNDAELRTYTGLNIVTRQPGRVHCSD
jgi:HK97 family phage major capsid protein